MSIRVKPIRNLLLPRAEDGRVSLAGHDPDATPGVKSEHAALKEAPELAARLFGLQERLHAESRRSLLVVLQAMDTGGKDGTISHVIGQLNPLSVRIACFKAPTPEELRHHFLWRCRRQLPGPSEVGIFNRSHYEDVLVARVKGLTPPAEVERRYAQINRFEEELVRQGTAVVKLFLHISNQEQRKRLVERLREPDKRWKFAESDIRDRVYWDDFQSAYDLVLTRCASARAPWYVVPANHKWYRNWAISRILIETLEGMAPRYPQPRLDVHRLLKRLEAE